MWFPLLGTWPAIQACALTGNQTSNLLICSPTLSPLSYTSQGNKNFLLCQNACSLIINFSILLSDQNFLSSTFLPLEPPLQQFSNVNKDANPLVLPHSHSQVLLSYSHLESMVHTVNFCTCHKFIVFSPVI